MSQAFFDRNYRSIHRIMPSGRASGNSVEVLVNLAEGAQTVSSFKFAGRPRGCCGWRSPENLQILTV